MTEDDAPESPLTFAFHAGTPNESKAPPTVPSLPSNTFINATGTPDAGTPVVVLFDTLGTGIRDREFAKEQLLAYVKQRDTRSSNPPLAIFVLNEKRLLLLRGFTEQRSLPELDAEVEHAIEERRELIRGEYDANPQLEALTQVAHFLLPIPGRKTLVWYAAVFPHSAYFYSGRHMIASPDLSEETRRLLDSLNLSDVSLYPVDVLGVRMNQRLSAATYDKFGVSTGIYRSFGMWNEGRVETATAMADATGGHAFYGTNDLEATLTQAIDNGANYYSLTYEPTNPKYDGSLRHIKVTLKQPGYTLAYRKTYYADDLNAVARAAADSPVSPLTPALERGTPLDHGLLVEAHLEASGAPVPATPEQMRVLAQYEAMRGGNRTAGKIITQAPPTMMQQYVVTYALVAHQLEMSASDGGNRKASLEFGAIAYDEEGRKLNGLDTRIDDPVSPDRYAKLLGQGYRVQQPLWIPASAKTLRLAVRDVTGNRTGSLEIPLPLAKPAEASIAQPQ